MKYEKKKCTAASKKKNVARLFLHSQGPYKIPAKLPPFWIICKPASHSGYFVKITH